MTPEETTGLKIIGIAFAIVAGLIVAVVLWHFGPAILDTLTDDGHRAYGPSAWQQRR